MQIPPPNPRQTFFCCRARAWEWTDEEKSVSEERRRGGIVIDAESHPLCNTNIYEWTGAAKTTRWNEGEKKMEESEMDVWRVPTSVSKLLQVQETHTVTQWMGSENTAIRRLDQLNPFQLFPSHSISIIILPYFSFTFTMLWSLKKYSLCLHTIICFQCWDRADNSNKESLSQHLKHFHWQCERLESTQLRPLRS